MANPYRVTRRSGPVAHVSPDDPVYVISIAAELTGVHPQTLRGYERAGLLDPTRTPGGSRRYSANDIDRVRRIQSLTEDGLPLAGVARILELERRLAQLSGPSTELVLWEPTRRPHPGRTPPNRNRRRSRDQRTPTTRHNQSRNRNPRPPRNKEPQS